MKPVQVHPQAKAEIKVAFDWYWQRSESAALGFDAAWRETISELRRVPRAFAQYLRGTRRAIVERYPYSIVFRELPRKIQIIAVAHAKRRPGYWAGRL
jgi:toxin ParE1/3/4